MKITVDLSKNKLYIDSAVYNISNKIRTIRDGTRKNSEVIRSIPTDFPYDPRPFPKGLWSITGVEWQKEKGFDPNTYGPVKIRTNAWQPVNVWKLDADGDYLRETEMQVDDRGYLLHYSVSSTTLGCIRLASPEDAVQIARVIEKLLAEGEEIILEVL